MRFELMIAAVTRNLVQAIVREVVATRSLVNAIADLRWLHPSDRLHRMPLVSMPGDISSYPINSINPTDFVALTNALGCQSAMLWALASKRGGVQYQPCLVLASRSARSARG